MATAREVQLHGGPADGKRINIDTGASRIIVPALSNSPFEIPESIHLVAMPFSGRLVPAPLPLVRAVYEETADGQFEYQEQVG
jgi:hypothetical protein